MVPFTALLMVYLERERAAAARAGMGFIGADKQPVASTSENAEPAHRNSRRKMFDGAASRAAKTYYMNEMYFDEVYHAYRSGEHPASKAVRSRTAARQNHSPSAYAYSA